jgi:hypothetical protein
VRKPFAPAFAPVCWNLRRHSHAADNLHPAVCCNNGTTRLDGNDRSRRGALRGTGQPKLSLKRFSLRQNAVDYIARNARQPRIQALELHRQAFVVDTQQVQHGGVEIGHGHSVLEGGVA